jgi:hypothetical protein
MLQGLLYRKILLLRITYYLRFFLLVENARTGQIADSRGNVQEGFYVQLSEASRYVGQIQAKELARMESSIDPVSTMYNQFNGMTMLANSMYNVEVGSRVNGYSRAKLIGAQGLGMFKSSATAIGTAVMVGTSWSGIGIAVGAGIIALGNSIQVNAQTGDSSTKMTDQAAIGTAVSIGAAFAPGVATTFGSSLVSSGFEYDAKGGTHGFNLSGTKGDAALVSASAAAVGSYVGGSMVDDMNLSGTIAGSAIGSVVSTSVNTISEYAKLKAYGAKYSNYASLTSADLSSGAGLLAGVYSKEIAGGVIDGLGMERGLDHRGTPIDQANQTDRSHRIMDSIWGAWETTKEWMSGAVNTVKGWFGGATGTDRQATIHQFIADDVASGRIVRYGTDAQGRPVYYNSEADYFVNADGAVSYSDGESVQYANNGDRAAAPGLSLTPEQVADMKTLFKTFQSDVDRMIKEARATGDTGMVERLMEARESLYQWEGNGADPRLKELARATQSAIGAGLGITNPIMKQWWCDAMSEWAVLTAEGANVESNPVDYFVKHAKIRNPYDAHGRNRIDGATAMVTAGDIIARSYKNGLGKLDWARVKFDANADQEQRYAALASFLGTTDALGVKFRASNEHTIAIIRENTSSPWRVWDTAGSHAHGTTFDPAGTAYRDSLLYRTYQTPEYYDYYYRKPIR